MEPACNEGRLQLMVKLVEAPPQVPAVALAETKVSGTLVTDGLRLSSNVMLVARSGPLLVMV